MPLRDCEHHNIVKYYNYMIIKQIMENLLQIAERIEISANDTINRCVFVDNCLPCATLIPLSLLPTSSNIICTVISLASLTQLRLQLFALIAAKGLRRNTLLVHLVYWCCRARPLFPSFLQHVNYIRIYIQWSRIKQYQILRVGRVIFDTNEMKGIIIKRLGRAERKNTRLKEERSIFDFLLQYNSGFSRFYFRDEKYYRNRCSEKFQFCNLCLIAAIRVYHSQCINYFSDQTDSKVSNKGGCADVDFTRGVQRVSRDKRRSRANYRRSNRRRIPLETSASESCP